MAGFENSAGLGVNNYYGPREKEGVGCFNTLGATRELVIDLDKFLIDNDIQRDIVTIPAGSLILNAYLDVSEVFAITGTTPTVLVGTDGSEVTNGLVISEAIIEALGVADLTATLTGTWDAKLAAETVIGIALGGTTPVLVSGGAARLVLEYLPS